MRPAPCCPKRITPVAYVSLRALRTSSLAEQHAPQELKTYSGSSATAMPLMRCLRIADGLNTITRRGEIGTSLPVLGLRPTRCPFLRTTKEQNDESFTVSPRSRQSVISLSTNSTSAADSVRDRPIF